jgi:DNA-binding MarR family transcriptional regulator
MDETVLRQSTYRAGLLQSRAYRALNSFMNKQLKPYGISLPEWAVIGSLVEQKTLRPSQIAQLLGIKQPVATRIISKLEDKGAVQRTADTQDSRATNIALTSLGNGLARDIESQLRPAMRTFLADIDRQQLATYLRVMEQIAVKD